MISRDVIVEAVRILQEAAPQSTVILFGSYARGDATDESDLDFLVVEPSVVRRRSEMVRLRDVLRPLRIPVDVLVTSRQVFDSWSRAPGSVLCQAAREGLVFDAVA